LPDQGFDVPYRKLVSMYSTLSNTFYQLTNNSKVCSKQNWNSLAPEPANWHSDFLLKFCIVWLSPVSTSQAISEAYKPPTALCSM